MADLSCIPHLSKDLVSKLHSIKIRSTDALLFSAATDQGKAHLLEHIGIEDALLSSCVAFAELLRLPGVGCRLARLFQMAGFGTVRGIAATAPAELAHQLHQRAGIVLSPRKAEHIVFAAHRLSRT